MSVTPIIDPQSIASLRALNADDNDEFLREIAGIFLEDTPKRIADLDQSLAAKDLGKFTRAAHSIKGSAANLGALVLRAAAEKLETHSRKEGFTGVEDMIATIKTDFVQAKAELERIIRAG